MGTEIEKNFREGRLQRVEGEGSEALDSELKADLWEMGSKLELKRKWRMS